MKNVVLIVEDEAPISDILSFNLKKEGYEVRTAFDGEEGLKKALEKDVDLVLLDVMLPVMDGFEVCKRIRISSSVPVIIVTAKEEEVDKVLGLELGADDYITKPFSMRELIARVKANIRRNSMLPTTEDETAGTAGSDILNVRDLTIDSSRYEVKKRGQLLELTVREYELLKYLAQNKDQVFSREQLLEQVWDYEYYGDIRTVDVTVRRLREKLEDNSSDPDYIMTKRGLGYYFKNK